MTVSLENATKGLMWGSALTSTALVLAYYFKNDMDDDRKKDVLLAALVLFLVFILFTLYPIISGLVRGDNVDKTLSAVLIILFLVTVVLFSSGYAIVNDQTNASDTEKLGHGNNLIMAAAVVVLVYTVVSLVRSFKETGSNFEYNNYYSLFGKSKSKR